MSGRGVRGGVGRGVRRGEGRGEGGARDRSDHGEGRAGGGQDLGFHQCPSCGLDCGTTTGLYRHVVAQGPPALTRLAGLLPGEPRPWQGWDTLWAKTTTNYVQRGSARALLRTIIEVSPHGRTLPRKASQRQESYAATGARFKKSDACSQQLPARVLELLFQTTTRAPGGSWRWR